MSRRPVIADASPLIACSQIGLLQVLPSLFDTVDIPPAVAQEIAPTVPSAQWLRQTKPQQKVGPQILSSNLGPGESEAITLALELDARLILLDDRPARRFASALQIPVLGTLGILLAAKRKQLITAVAPYLNGLIELDFRVSRRLLQQVLRDAGESL